MPLPFILGAVAVAAAGYGVKKGYDGYQTKEAADSIIESSKRRYREAKERLDAANKATEKSLENLGALQLKIGSSFTAFRTIANELLKKLDQAGHHHDPDSFLPQYRLNQIKDLEFSSVTYLAQMAGAGAAGGAAAFAVYGSVMTLAAASTGTPIAALSGAAAYNATMAAIGGGALSAGGFGMAGGAAILGGVVAAPVLAIAGWAYNAHAEKALDNARDIRQEVDKSVEFMDLAHTRLVDTRDYAVRIRGRLSSIYEIFCEYHHSLEKMEQFIRNGGDIYQVEEKTIQIIENGYKVAAILTDIINTPLFKPKLDKEGKVVLGKDNAVEIETDRNGFQVLNRDTVNDVVKKSYSDVKALTLG